MIRTRTLVLGILVPLGGVGVVEHQLVQRQHAMLSEHSREMAAHEQAQRMEAAALARTRTEAETSEREIDAMRAGAADAEARSLMKLWANRIALLRQLLGEMPGQSLPELRLLSPKDWVQVVRTRELDSADQIRAAFASLRSFARRRMAEKLQEALKRYTDASNGELPADIAGLAPHLSTPADREMLARYSLLRSGRLDNPEEHFIKETASGDMILSVGLHGWNISHNAEWDDPDPDQPATTLARLSTLMEPVMDGFQKEDATTFLQLFKWETFRELTERLGPQMDAMFGDSLGDQIKAAVKRYGAERNGAVPANFAEIAPYFTNFEQLITMARPILAELEYMRDHLGQRATDPEKLRRYLQKPIDQLEILRELKLTVDGDSVTMNFSTSLKGTKKEN